MRYGVSMMVFAHADLEAALRRIAASGFDRIEINSEPPHLCSGEYDPRVVRGWLDDLGLRAPVGHGLFSHDNPNAAALDEADRRRSVEIMASCFEPLVTVGAEVVVLHPTGYAKDYCDDNRQAHVDQARRSMRELAKVGADLGIRMAWENLPHHGAARPLHDMRELRPLIEDMPAHVGLCLDTTHAVIAGHDPIEQLNIASDRLFCLHLHDTDGQRDCHWVPGRGVIDWQQFVARLDETAFNGTRTLEVTSTPQTAEDVVAEAFGVALRWG
jgi:sugar phosphate isomerase/epimerase